MDTSNNTNESTVISGDSSSVGLARDLEELRDADKENENDTRINASRQARGIMIDDNASLPASTRPTGENEREVFAEYQKTSEQAHTRNEVPHGQEEHVVVATLAKNEHIKYCCILRTFVFVAVASGVTGALIVRRTSPDVIAASTDLNAPQTTMPLTNALPTANPTSPPTYSSPTEEPLPGSTPTPATASPTTPAPIMTPRQSTIHDAFADFGPVHEASFEWLLDSDTWTPSEMVSDQNQLWHERYAIATLFYSTNVPHLATSAISTTFSTCQWSRIGCSDGLHVDELDVSDSSMSGFLPSEIGILTSLTYLNIAYNHIEGNVPSEIGLLSSLNDVMIAHNLLTGSLPKELGLLSNLWFLLANNNKLTGSLSPQLGNFLGVDLSFNKLSETIPGDLFTDRLSMLILNDNDLSGSIPDEVGSASAMTTLWLWNNQLTGSIPPLHHDLLSCKLENNAFSDTLNAYGVCHL